MTGNEPSDETLRSILGRSRTVAVVGLSDKPERDSHEVAAYLQRQGYRIVPVNPKVARVLGEPAYPTLSAIPPEIQVDAVDIFRRPEEVPPVVNEALARGVGVVWMQLGVTSPEAARRAEERGVLVVQDRCIMREHRRLGVGPVVSKG
jgi:predicted CoA-binding protein